MSAWGLGRLSRWFSPLPAAQSKKGKDPNAPKRPMSAYMLWLNANREKIKSDHPGISITDLSKKAGELWKAMSKEKKEVGRSEKEARGENGCSRRGRVDSRSPAWLFLGLRILDLSSGVV